MGKDILGIGSCAKALGITAIRIKHLIWKKKINPKKLYEGYTAPYVFTPKDQEIIRRSTADHD